jgi:hypothetical protein
MASLACLGMRKTKHPLPGALQLITNSLDYDLGAFWIVNDLRMTLDCAEYFNRGPQAFPQFEAVTRSRHFSVGEGLPETVWSTREVLHIPDVTCAENFPRSSIAKQEGLHTGIGFPLYSGKTVLGLEPGQTVAVPAALET